MSVDPLVVLPVWKQHGLFFSEHRTAVFACLRRYATAVCLIA